jgi:hypothetical protein
MAATNLKISFDHYVANGELPKYLTADYMDKYDPFKGARAWRL